MKTEKYILYARKSTESEDKQCESIDDQLAEMRAIAKEKKLHIAQEFTEAKSAHEPGKRKEFEKMMALIKTSKYHGIIVWDLSRLSRNPEDAGRVQQSLRGAIKCIVTHNGDYTKKDNIVLSMTSALDTDYSDKLSDNVIRGMKRKASDRHMPPLAIPPIGYRTEIVDDMSKKGGHGKIISPDPNDFYKVRQLWEKALSGVSSIPQLTDYANTELGLRTPKHKSKGGKPLTRNGVAYLLSNPFYYGIFRWHGELYTGSYETMVTKEEWDAVQNIIDNNRHTTRPKDKTEDYIFRGCFKCGNCGYAVTSETRHKHLANGDIAHYKYYHCTGKCKGCSCNQKSICIPELELVNQVKRELSKYAIHPELLPLICEALDCEDKAVAKQNMQDRDSIKSRIKKIDSELDDLNELYFESRGSMPVEFYQKKQNELKNEQASLKERLKKAASKNKWRSVADDLFTFARYAKEDFDSDSIENKKAVMRALGKNMTILARTIDFSPMPYLVLLENITRSGNRVKNSARTDSQQRKNGPLGTVSPQWCA